MLGLVLLHVIDQGGARDGARYIWSLFRPCLVGFVFISGYYGIKFSCAKVVRFVLVAIWCALVSSLIAMVMTGDRGSIVASLRGYWFVWSYLVLMCLAPILNRALECNWRIGIPIVVVVFCWSYLSIMPVIKLYVPSCIGFGPATPLTLVGVYCAARMFKLAGIEDRIKLRCLILVLPLAMGLAALGFSHYNSPVSFAVASIGFVAFNRLHVSGRASTIITFITPSLLPIYFLHQSFGGYGMILPSMRFFQDAMSFAVPISWICTTLLVFSVCFTIDLIRRFLVLCIAKISVSVAR